MITIACIIYGACAVYCVADRLYGEPYYQQLRLQARIDAVSNRYA